MTHPEEPGQVGVGIVGTAEAIDKTLKLLEEISQPIEQDADVDCVLRPSFPGLNVECPFQVHLVTQTQWQRPLNQEDLRSLDECGDSSARRRLLHATFSREVRAISKLQNPPKVVLCAVSEPIARLFAEETASSDGNYAVNNEILRDGGEHISHSLLREFRGDRKSVV
jgi:hypothetical protein